MAKVPATIPELEAEVAAARAVLAQAQEVYNRKYLMLKARYDKINDARMAALGQLSVILEATNSLGASNSTGYRLLNEKTHRGSWAEGGLKFNGSQWTRTNQYVLRVEMDHQADLDYYARTELNIAEILPHVLAGAYEGSYEAWKVFRIGNGFDLVYRPDETWAIVVGRSRGRVEVRFEGTLRAMLEQIKAYWPANVPYVEEPDDGEIERDWDRD